MAGAARRSLTSGFTLISRWPHPSLSHLLSPTSHYRERTEPQLPASNQPPSFLRSPPTLGSPPPLGLLPFLRPYSSSPSEAASEIKDVANVLSDAALGASSSAAASAISAPFPGEVAAAAADSFPPVAALQHVIDTIHSVTGFNWWACIALTTLLIRGLTVPLLINQMKSTIKLSAMRPEMEKLKERVDISSDPQTMLENQKAMKELFKKHGVTPFTPMKGIFIQGPIFMSFFFAISNMVEKVPSFKGGGAFWFTDLTTPDPFYALPIITGLVFLATVELNMQEGMEGNPMAGTMKKFSRGLAVLTVPLTASFPKAIFCYWITSNLFSLAYGAALKRPPIRKFLNIPDPPPVDPAASQRSFSFFGVPKSPAPISAPSSGSDMKLEAVKAPERRISSSTVMSQRIRNLEKQAKSRNKPKKK